LVALTPILPVITLLGLIKYGNRGFESPFQSNEEWGVGKPSKALMIGPNGTPFSLLETRKSRVPPKGLCIPGQLGFSSL
jgi:hypothetical protein